MWRKNTDLYLLCESAIESAVARLPRAAATNPSPRVSQRADTKLGGADRDRTDDPLLAKQVLSQLSYSPSPRPCTASPRLQTTPRPWLYNVGGSGWVRTNDPRLIKTVL